MKILKLLSIILCTVIVTSTYNANGVETGISTYNENNVNIKINDDILNDNEELFKYNEFVLQNDCGGCTPVKELCLKIKNKTLTVAELNKFKERLIEAASFYFEQAKDCEYYGDSKTMKYMSNIFDLTNKLIQKLSPDINFSNTMNTYIAFISQYIPY